eukprot:TRINITY_DN301590_c1_g1_i1.p1 TRINITY_DN301590_c1_g1~~TRINITY_DN301590_c1_g1_i1.p1  ORF type:complete len:157 (+),score=27.11 TRINITY_DN301590_c1_g1_i1:112-582(+)
MDIVIRDAGNDVKFDRSSSNNVGFTNNDQSVNHKANSGDARAVIPIGISNGICEWELKLENASNGFNGNTAFGIVSSFPFLCDEVQHKDQNAVFCNASATCDTGMKRYSGKGTFGSKMEIGSVLKMRLDMNAGIDRVLQQIQPIVYCRITTIVLKL